MNVFDPANTNPLEFGNRLLTLAKSLGYDPVDKPEVYIEAHRSFLTFKYYVQEDPIVPTEPRQVHFKPSTLDFSVSRYDEATFTWELILLDVLSELDQDPAILQAIIGRPY